MKPTKILVALATLAIASNAQAVVLIAAYHSFDATTSNESPDLLAGGWASSLSKDGQASVATGGSNDGNLGNDTALPFVAPSNDGYLRAPINRQPVISLTNNTAMSTQLSRFLFDAGAPAPTPISLTYSLDGATWNLIGTTPDLENLALGPVGGSADFGDFVFDISFITVGIGDTVSFRFQDSIAGVRIDNIGITAVPEPTNVMALALLLTSGVMFRNRRRKA